MTAPVDEAVRRLVREASERAIALEAGAGTGKTTALVDRVLALLAAGVPLSRLAIITFLRAAAEELRVRLRSALADRGDAWAKAARLELPAAAIGTIHAFAQRILVQEALAAGWDPATRVLEGLAADAFARRQFRAWLETATADDPSPLVAVRRLGAGLSAESLFALASALAPDAPLGPPPPPPNRDDLDRFVGALVQARTTFDAVRGLCLNPEDSALAAGPMLAHALAELDAWPVDERPLVACGLSLPSAQAGNQRNWSPGAGLATLKAAIADARTAQAALRRGVGARAAHALLAWLAPSAAAAALARRNAGVATFDDLLRRAVDLLTTDAEARRRVSARYQVVLVDEFQDTDPLQAELVRLVAGDPVHDAAGAVARRFVVGDPKQSIYRFRGADVDVYLRVRDAFPPDGRLAIRHNFRALTPLLEVANRVVAPLMATGPIAYTPLEGGRGEAEAGAVAPLVVLEAASDGADGDADAWDEPGAEGARRREAALVAAHLAALFAAGARVGGRRLEPGDVALLFATRTAFPAYTQALAAAGIPFAAERDSGLWHRPVARAAAALLTAIARPRDALAVVAALRSPLIGASDQDLVDLTHAGGRPDLGLAPPVGAPPHVVRALDALARAAAARALRPSERLAALAAALDLGAAAALVEGEEGVAALQRVLESVRALEVEAGDDPGALAAVAAALADVGWERPRAALPEPAQAPDPPVAGGRVRLMTVHEAKGNEFPLVALCDLWGGGARDGGPRLVKHPASGRLELVLQTDWLMTEGAADALAAERAAQAAERVRLLYVALTRARDALVLPDARPKRAGSDSFGALIARAAGGSAKAPLVDHLRSLGLAPAVVRPPAPAQGTRAPVTAADLAGSPADLADWQAALAQRAAAVPIVRPSAAETPGPAAGPEERMEDVGGDGFDRDAARRLGLAVHAVVARALAALRAGEGPDVTAWARHEAERHALTAQAASEVEALARRALSHPLLQRACATERLAIEAPVSARLADGALVLGRVDLAFADGDAVTLVDLKTDRLAVALAATPPATLAAAHARHYGYDRQLRLYAQALAKTTGMRVAAAHVLYCRHAVAVDVLAAGDQELAPASPVPASDPPG